MPAFGISAVLYAAAVVFSLIAWLSTENFDLLGLGIACLAAGLLVTAVGMDRRLGGGGTVTRP
jgi:hypothetical protein